MIEEFIKKLLISMCKNKTKHAHTQQNLFWISKYLYSLNSLLIITKHVFDIQIILSHIVQMRSWLTQAHSSSFLVALTSIEIERKLSARLGTIDIVKKSQLFFNLNPNTPSPQKTHQNSWKQRQLSSLSVMLL